MSQNLQQVKSERLCAKTLVEIAERIARILLIVSYNYNLSHNYKMYAVHMK